uniref:Uncharacterized protein n=1 Tax=Romanomermis culicivorax TaxID=13658 RepID=A0A915J1S4_ROMCU
MEEAGARYLRSRNGASKRHTIHHSPATAAVANSAATPSSSKQFLAATQSSTRVTDSSHMLTSDTLRHLERLYQNALQRKFPAIHADSFETYALKFIIVIESESPVESMRSLQQEFQQLRATTEMMQQQPQSVGAFSATNALNCCDIWRSSPRSSPPTQMLGMIAEHEPYDASPLDRFRNVQQQPPPLNLVAAAARYRQNLSSQMIDAASQQPMDVVDAAATSLPHKLNGNAAAPVINIFNDAGNSTNL